MLKFDREKTLLEIRAAQTADLVDRITAYRQGMEPKAVEMIEQELRSREVSQAQIDARADECRQECLVDATGTALTCSRCRRPAVTEVIGWHRLFGVVPVFPRRLRFCKEHAH